VRTACIRRQPPAARRTASRSRSRISRARFDSTCPDATDCAPAPRSASSQREGGVARVSGGARQQGWQQTKKAEPARRGGGRAPPSAAPPICIRARRTHAQAPLTAPLSSPTRWTCAISTPNFRKSIQVWFVGPRVVRGLPSLSTVSPCRPGSGRRMI